MQKYLDADAPRGANAFLDTGDLGYLHDGEIFVSGRAKDLVLVRGRNIWLQDIEWLAERVPPLVAGDTAAIAVDDDVNGSLVLLVQRAVTDADAQEALRQQLVDAVLQALGVTVRVLFLPARSLLFTTSGKLARQQMRQRYSSGAWDMVSSRDAFRSLAVEPTT
jgi:fatty-acyl-CoA synthase